MKKIIYVLLLCTSFLACKKKNDDPAPSTSTNNPSNETNASFAFLKDGHQWNYDYNIIGSTGTLSLLTDSIEPYLYKMTSIYDAEDGIVGYWFVSGEYLQTYADGKTKADGKIIYKSNASLNDSWNNIDPSNNHIIYYKVVNADTTIVTSAGTLDHCKKIQVTFNYAFNTQYNYWNESYGLVYQTGFSALDLTGKNFRSDNPSYGYTRW